MNSSLMMLFHLVGGGGGGLLSIPNIQAAVVCWYPHSWLLYWQAEPRNQELLFVASFMLV